ncbi:MBL fold metallo-hydrolase [Halostreptopolyspora alba]|uniref:MBL fold metallo-hydrolase n=1 Tax=Halostreptopolyspora alba TaxID=2487137 RepID=A0A3N0ECL5_9ACTN|nr:MBL fold metallo-hydrolase [Nocardiopsaceae bacterium YIM 96095]
MFWKWKGKKKDGEEPESAEESSAVTTKTGDESDEATTPATAADSGATDNEATAEKDAVDATGAAEEVDEGTEATGDDRGADADTPEKGEETAEETAANAATDGAKGEDTTGEDGADETGDPDPEEPGVTEPDSEGVQRVRTAGTLRIDDGEFDVISNTWIVDADDEGVIVVDPAHDAKAILEAVGDREIYLVACTNGYNTHVSAAVEVAERDEAPIALHPRELRSWRKVHGAERRPDHEIEGGGTLAVGDLEVDVLAVPGTSNGSVAFYISERGVVLSGDTLRRGELGTVGEGYLDYTRQLHSVGEVLLSLPPDTRVLPDSGPETTVEAESKNFDAWVATS